MGTFRAGQWIISIFIYFIVYFFLVFSITSSKAIISVSDLGANYSDPGLMALQGFVGYGGKCTKPTELGGYFTIGTTISCEELAVNNKTCNLVHGCAWSNSSFWFSVKSWMPWYSSPNYDGEQYCKGTVNLTYVGIQTFNGSGWVNDYQNTDLPIMDVCGKFYTEDLCGIFTCTWQNTSELVSINVNNPIQMNNAFGTFNEAFKFMLGFNTDVGLTNFQWVWALFFTYLPSLLLFYSIYMALRGS